MEWLWGSLASAAFGALAYLVTLAIRSHVSDTLSKAKDHTDASVKSVASEVATIRLDLAHNYVRKDDDVMKEMREDTRKSLHILSKLQLALAKKFKFTIDDEADDER